MTNVQTAYEKGVLNPVSHAMLVSDAAKYCQRAGIAEQWLYRASSDTLGKFDQVKVGVLGDVLTSRAAEGLQTVVWVHSMEGVLKSFGQRVHVLLTKS
jgi:hypothetical protein